MKTVALTTALVLTATAPAFAGSDADAIFDALRAEDETSNYVASVEDANSANADAVFVAIRAESDDANNGLNYSVSSKGGAEAAAVLKLIKAED